MLLGEISLINNLRRTAMVKSLQPTLVASLDASGFRKHAEAYFMKTCEEHVHFLASIPLFSNWATKRLFQFSSCFSKRKVRKGEWIYRQNEDSPNKVFVVSHGSFHLRRAVNKSDAEIKKVENNPLAALAKRDGGHVLVELNSPCIFGVEEHFFGATKRISSVQCSSLTAEVIDFSRNHK